MGKTDLQCDKIHFTHRKKYDIMNKMSAFDEVCQKVYKSYFKESEKNYEKEKR